MYQIPTVEEMFAENEYDEGWQCPDGCVVLISGRIVYWTDMDAESHKKTCRTESAARQLFESLCDNE